MLHVDVCCAIASVPCSLVVTCWERADLLAVVCVVFCHFPKCVCVVFCHFPKCVLVYIRIKRGGGGGGWRHETGLSPSVKYCTDRSKAVLLLWIFYFFLSCNCCAIVGVCLFVPCGHLLGKG